MPPHADNPRNSAESQPIHSRRVRVLTTVPVPTAYDYLWPGDEPGGSGGDPPNADGQMSFMPEEEGNPGALGAPDVPTLLPPDAAQVGCVVVVPVGGRSVFGVITDVDPDEDAGAPARAKLKDVQAVADTPLLAPSTLAFLRWVADYTLVPPGSVLRMVLSCPDALRAPKGPVGYRVAVDAPEDPKRLSAARQRVLAFLDSLGGLAQPAETLAAEAGVSRQILRAAAKAGFLEMVSLPPTDQRPATPPSLALAPPSQPDESGSPTLSSDQQEAAQTLLAAADEAAFSVTVLEGVTGSGKTEVYLEAVAAQLRQDKRVLVLLPEIALTGSVLARFVARFGAHVAVWHSELPSGERRKTYRAIVRGHKAIVIGARSALFLPVPDLGLVVVDEEHDAAYKQDDGVPYNGRDMAVVRGRIGTFPVVLVSATPSLETIENVRQGRYGHVQLPERHGGATMPEIDLVDIRRTPPQKWTPSMGGESDKGASEGASQTGFLAPPVIEAVQRALEAGEQALLFLNRRGYAPLTLCRSCGHRLQCDSCSAWLVEHRRLGRVLCHHCGYSAPLPKTCPACGAEDSFAACGPGVERLADEVRARFPEARLAVASSDTLIGPTAAADLAESIRNRSVDVIIGTQVMAKGHHFPYLTMVGVVDGDLGLSGGDLRAAERTHQLLRQVAGRAGRATLPGRVLIQTADPSAPVMQALAVGDAIAFLREESEQRRMFGYPPFGRLAALVLSGDKPDLVEAAARALGQSSPQDPGVTVLGPAPPPLKLLRGKHRQRLLVLAPKSMRLQPILSAWTGRVKLPASVRLRIDIDPYSFL